MPKPTVAACEVPYFDVSDPCFSASSAAVHAARERGWYARTNFGLAVLRYEQTSALLKDRRLRQGSYAWPEQNGITEGPLARWWALNVLSAEGDDHRRLRRIANPAFSRSLMERMVPGFRDLAGELVDAFAGRGRCEFVSEFAEPYSARVLCRLVGLDEGRWQDVSHWSTDIGLAFGVTIAQDRERIEIALAKLYGLADELIAERREAPGDDVISGLVAAHDGEARLTHAELQAMIALIIFGGMDTTKNQLGLAMQLFVDHPDQWTLLAERPELAANAVEEVIRFNPTVVWTTRRAVEDITFEGLEIPRGTTLHLLSPPANTDPLAVGDEPFDITIERRAHFGFGGGAHHCLGHWLARIDMREALPLLAWRLPGLRLTRPATFRPQSGVTGAVELPIEFRARRTGEAQCV
jgi:cytochrome P450